MIKVMQAVASKTCYWRCFEAKATDWIKPLKFWIFHGFSTILKLML